MSIVIQAYENRNAREGGMEPARDEIHVNSLAEFYEALLNHG